MIAPHTPACLPPFEALYGTLPMGVVLATQGGDVVFANPEFFRLTECTERDLNYMSFADVLSMFSLPPGVRSKESGGLENKWHTVDKYIFTQDRGIAWVRIHATSIDVVGQCFQQLLVEDVSTYKEHLDTLLDRKELYQSIVERRPDPICCFLPDWSITYANASCCRYFASNRKDILGEDLLLLLSPEMREKLAQVVENISIETPAAEIEQFISDFEGKPLWIRWIIQGFFYKTGHIKDYQAIGMDITDQKITESRFIHADRLVSLGTLVSSVAHEINNPNNFIMLNAPLAMDLWWRVAPVLEQRSTKEQADVADDVPIEDVIEHMPQLLQGIIEGSNRIKAIVRELNTFSRQDTDSGFEQLSVNDIVQSAVLLMSKTIALHTSRFSVSYGLGLPMVRGRRQRLEQIVVNLIQNACNALESREQGIHVETFCHKKSGTVRIALRDEGVGIRPEDLPRVTEPFFSTRSAHGGTGLGLSISLSIAREHGGQLLFESTQGKGTAASIVLPAARQKANQS